MEFLLIIFFVICVILFNVRKYCEYIEFREQSLTVKLENLLV